MSIVELNNIKHYDYNFLKNICYDIKNSKAFNQQQFTDKLQSVKEQFAILLYQQNSVDHADDRVKYLNDGINEIKQQFHNENPDMSIDLFFNTDKVVSCNISDFHKANNISYSIYAYYKPIVENDIFSDYEARYIEDVSIDDSLSLDA